MLVLVEVTTSTDSLDGKQSKQTNPPPPLKQIFVRNPYLQLTVLGSLGLLGELEEGLAPGEELLPVQGVEGHRPPPPLLGQGSGVSGQGSGVGCIV